MIRYDIPWKNFESRIFQQWAEDWFLLTAGDFRKKEYNMMTVAWGAFGVLWDKPFAMIFVRPQRFTAPILDRYDSFTLCAFPDSMRSALQFCGTKSGRDCPDKAKAAGLTPVASRTVAAPSYDEAELAVECVQTYVSALDPKGFLPKEQAGSRYPAGDFHRIWFGEITSVSGTDKYRKHDAAESGLQ